jgi:NAD+ diphosphatase
MQASPYAIQPIQRPLRWDQPPRHWACLKIPRPGHPHCSSPCTGTLQQDQQPPSSAARFVPALHPPDEPPRAALWFAFSGDRLLVRPSQDRAEVVEYADLAKLDVAFDEGHYLGRLDDVDCYAVELPTADAPEGATLEGLRALYGRLPDDQYSIAGRAVQILLWDNTHRFCGRCGQPTVNAPGERAKLCPQCGLLNFPRLSPAVIMLIRRGEDEFLLARNRGFAEGFFSVLAGFVEPGESLEEAVAREVHEEVNLDIQDIRYFGSQPWPFPHQLMIGFTANYAGGEIRPQADEIAEAGWYSRRGELPRLPGKLSIARRLIDSFLAE